ncbi:MAG: alpha-galactosidase, partial [Ornithinimicrobium sp.]|uniref:alpha-galactosidase n=1 Tax=Ornithinimicrobium sp. TaxID=1977084 RepID=UPI003D9B1962
IGTHVGAAQAHTTGRHTHLDFRCLTALFGHAGIEYDISALDEEELARIAGWVGVHQRLRGLLHGGRTVRLDERDGAWLHGVVAPDRAHAVYAFVRLVTGADALPGLVRLPGLDPELDYAVRAIDPTRRDDVPVRGEAMSQPAWCSQEGVVLRGRALARYGLAMPVLNPAAGLLIEVTAQS